MGSVDVVVTGSRTERPLSEAPVTTEVITAKEIGESGARTIAELLEEQPGIYLDRSFAGAGPQLQGLPADYTLILVNGVRVAGPRASRGGATRATASTSIPATSPPARAPSSNTTPARRSDLTSPSESA